MKFLDLTCNDGSDILLNIYKIKYITRIDDKKSKITLSDIDEKREGAGNNYGNCEYVFENIIVQHSYEDLTDMLQGL